MMRCPSRSNARSAPRFRFPMCVHMTSDSGMASVAFGYSWASNIPIRNEIGYTSHDAGTVGFGGSSSVASDMVNFALQTFRWAICGSCLWRRRPLAPATPVHWTTQQRSFRIARRARMPSLSNIRPSRVLLSLAVSETSICFVDYRYRGNQDDSSYSSSLFPKPTDPCRQPDGKCGHGRLPVVHDTASAPAASAAPATASAAASSASAAPAASAARRRRPTSSSSTSISRT